MPQRNTQKLRTVSNFSDLVDYLRDDLDWPIEVEDAEEIVFEYDADELGIDPKYAVKINSIRQIRPLAEGQPWGVFYIDFESKKLPVVVLRRILRAFVSSTRSRQAERPVWDMNDLLFISAFGEEVSDQREIAFAHFHQEANDLPTLRVLGWDGSDTPLKLEYVDATLQRTMRWPDDPNDHDAWREAWSQTFRHRVGHVIRTADALAAALAGLARQIRAAALLLLAHETESGPLRSLHKAFQKALIHDLSEADFADTYAQTITYGLLTAAISRTEMSDGQYGTALIADNVAEMRMTNPFLKEMLQTFLRAGGRKKGIDFDELGIQDVVELLRGDETDLPAILRDFGNKTKGEDPVIHFYEHFLAAYNKELKAKRGVFYTPKPVVGYIVRSVHELLRTEFGLEDGLADTTTWGEMEQRHPDLVIHQGTDPDSPFVVILDPATGTATFLVEVIEVIHQTMTVKWRRSGLNMAEQKAAWNEYVPQYLLPRLYGYELMMAPYAIAHMKMGLKLYETGYKFNSEERVRIYLTNTLEKPDNHPSLAGILPALAHEAQAVNKVKQKAPITILIGNPPYSNRGKLNQFSWISDLLQDYKTGLNEKKINLDDDFIKFVRWSQRRIEETGYGILAFITNHTYIDGVTHRRMRQNLLETFDDTYIFDLHGNSKKGEICPDGSRDDNVFDIQQGVAISIFAKRLQRLTEPNVYFAELWGLRERKYAYLLKMDVSSNEWNRLEDIDSKSCLGTFYFFTPKAFDNIDEYCDGWPVTDIFPVYSNGIETHRDKISIHYDSNRLLITLEDIRSLSPEEFRKAYDLGADGRDWTVNGAKLSAGRLNLENFRPTKILYRPFDFRYTYLNPENKGFIAYPRYNVMQHMKGANLGVVLARIIVRDDSFDAVLASRFITEKKTGDSTRSSSLFPLYLYPEISEKERPQKHLMNTSYWSPDRAGRTPNLNASFITAIQQRLQMRFASESTDDAQNFFGPEDIFRYIYAILHSLIYRDRYAEFLKIDFPRLPITTSIDLFRGLALLGEELVILHSMEFALPKEKDVPVNWSQYSQLTHFDGSKFVIEKFPSAKKAWQAGRVSINACSGFIDVPEEVWNFYIGGYQVCHKWLKDRKGRTLSDADILHYSKIVTALNETIRIMAEIDEVIEEHGGWPIQ